MDEAAGLVLPVKRRTSIVHLKRADRSSLTTTSSFASLFRGRARPGVWLSSLRPARSARARARGGDPRRLSLPLSDSWSLSLSPLHPPPITDDIPAISHDAQTFALFTMMTIHLHTFRAAVELFLTGRAVTSQSSTAASILLETVLEHDRPGPARGARALAVKQLTRADLHPAPVHLELLLAVDELAKAGAQMGSLGLGWRASQQRKEAEEDAPVAGRCRAARGRTADAAGATLTARSGSSTLGSKMRRSRARPPRPRRPFPLPRARAPLSTRRARRGSTRYPWAHPRQAWQASSGRRSRPPQAQPSSSPRPGMSSARR